MIILRISEEVLIEFYIVQNGWSLAANLGPALGYSIIKIDPGCGHTWSVMSLTAGTSDIGGAQGIIANVRQVQECFEDQKQNRRYPDWDDGLP